MSTGYDMGFSQGMLLKDRLLKMWDMFFDYVVKNTHWWDVERGKTFKPNSEEQ